MINICQLTELFPDECLMGFFYRLFGMSGYSDLEHFEKKLGLSDCKVEPLCLVNRTEIEFSNYVKAAFKLEQQPYWTHGSGAYFKPFLNIHAIRKINFLFQNNSKDNGKFFVPQPYENAPSSSVAHWKWCPECAKEDIVNVGIAYWHMSHQLPALTKCSKHGCLLTQNNDSGLRGGQFLPKQDIDEHHNLLAKPVYLSTQSQKVDWFHKCSVDLLTMTEQFDFQVIYAKCISDFNDLTLDRFTEERLISISMFMKKLGYSEPSVNPRSVEIGRTIFNHVRDSLLLNGFNSKNWPNPAYWLATIASCHNGIAIYDEAVASFNKKGVSNRKDNGYIAGCECYGSRSNRTIA